MKYSIFHTSHCGSTLLATLLRESIETYCEPKWTNYSDCRYFMMAKDNTLVKYPSYTSMACRILPGKKIFIFRSLKDHLEKITSQKRLIEQNLKLYYPFCREIRNLFPNLIVDNDLQKLAFVWVHRYLDAYYSQEIMSINANNFFLNPNKVMNQITEFLNIQPVKNFEALNFYVKKDFNCKDERLSQIQPKDKIEYHVRDGLINSNNFKDIEDWVDQEILKKIKSHNIFPLLRDKNNTPIYSFIPGVTIKV